MRKFNGKEVELLAPAGNFDILRELVHTKCDAFYLGGKQFNMRMHRENFNFSNNEIKDSIHLAHENDKKIYVTINNMMFNHEIAPCLEYLYYLEEIAPDALIIQDMSIVSLINDNKLDLPMHSSIMMNVHNFETIKNLSTLGVSRVVVSREIDLKTIKSWNIQSPMEFEYFVHGDMCSTHGSQCYYSGVLFGNSSNRGLCMKPCRWDFKVKYKGSFYNTEFPTAVKDMYMYENIPELIYAGVNSFKIEGRMRESSYLERIIEAYGDSINRYIEDPIFYDRYKETQTIYQSRKRDFSTAYAFGHPGLDNINRRYEGTGYFYSTGKVFSKPIPEHSMDKRQIENAKLALQKDFEKPHKQIPQLSVRCDTLSQVKSAISLGVELIYISTENFVKEHGLSAASIIEASHVKRESKLILCLPKMTFDDDFEKYDVLLQKEELRNAIDGLMASNLGALKYFQKFNLPIYGDITLNIGNTFSHQLYKKQGLENAVLSIEMNIDNIVQFMKSSDKRNIEIIAHGSPTMMYMDLDLYENIKHREPTYPADNIYFHNDVLVLVDDKGFEHPVYRDHRGKNHFLLNKDICLLPIHKELQNLGISIFRLEISHYNIDDFETAIKTYHQAFTSPEETEEIFKNLMPNHMDYSLGSLFY